MTNFVLPGQKFFVSYVCDGVGEDYAVPDITTTTDDVLVTLNGLVQPPYEVYTVHQGRLHFVAGPPPAGFVAGIRV